MHDFSSDLWGLGVLVHVLLAGKFPFDQGTPPQEELNLLIEAIPNLSDAARFLLHGMLQVEPSRRLSWEHLGSLVVAWCGAQLRNAQFRLDFPFSTQTRPTKQTSQRFDSLNMITV